MNCSDCGHDTFRDEHGTCLWCFPRVYSDEPQLDKCGQCGTEFEPFSVGGIAKRFCSRKCQQQAWSVSEKGYLWRARKREAENAKRDYLRSLGVRRNSRLERAS